MCAFELADIPDPGMRRVLLAINGILVLNLPVPRARALALRLWRAGQSAAALPRELCPAQPDRCNEALP